MNELKFKVLKHKKLEGDKSWLLCECNLYDYLNTLKPDFYEYAIQRKIVQNDFLDELFSKTVINNEPFPIITLTTKLNTHIEEGKEYKFDPSTIEILDGLQRTFRLWAHLFLFQKYADSANKDNYKAFSAELKNDEKGKMFFDLGILKTSYIHKLIETNKIEKIKTSFESFKAYFYLWTNLNDFEVVNKMLLLNLGQKSVSAKHQFELLFLYFIRHFQESKSGIKIIRERQTEAKDLKTENREIGNFLFSSVVIAMISLYESKTKRVNKKELDFEIEDEKSFEAPVFQILFKENVIETFLTCLFKLDSAIAIRYKGQGKRWFGKDTTLSGIFAGISNFMKIDLALKEYVNSTPVKYEEARKTLIEKTTAGTENLVKAINEGKLDIDSFNAAYEKLSSRSVNIGNVVRNGIKEYVSETLNGKEANWSNFIK